MKIQYNDSMAELRSLLDVAKEGSCIIVTKAEMKAIVTNGTAPELFPQFFELIKNRTMRLDQQISESKKRASAPSISSDELQEQFDKQSQYERQARSLSNEVPSQLIAKNGILVKVSITA
jgi:hypothetical protein